MGTAFFTLFVLVGTFVLPDAFPELHTDAQSGASGYTATLVVTVPYIALFVLGCLARPLITWASVQVRHFVVTNVDRIRRRVARWLLRDVPRP